MTNIQKAFICSWEDCIHNELTIISTKFGYKLSEVSLEEFVDKGMEIVNEISWNIPENITFMELREYNKKCLDKLENLMAAISCAC